jgi:cyclopropane fatty-acyl-phospholipid synthase-like methyltransferase
MGCGCGGSSFAMAERGADVIGVDFTDSMVEICAERAPDIKKQDGTQANVRFQQGSMVDASLFPASSFDVVYCRDALLYIKHEEIKQTLRNFRTWLRPAGRLMVTNYNLAATPGPAIKEYQQLAQLTLQTLEEFAAEVESVGFTLEKVEESPDFAKHYKESYDAFVKREVAFKENFGSEHYDKLKYRWELKLAAIKEGGMRGGMVMAMA